MESTDTGYQRETAGRWEISFRSSLRKLDSSSWHAPQMTAPGFQANQGAKRLVMTSLASQPIRKLKGRLWPAAWLVRKLFPTFSVHCKLEEGFSDHLAVGEIGNKAPSVSSTGMSSLVLYQLYKYLPKCSASVHLSQTSTTSILDRLFHQMLV